MPTALRLLLFGVLVSALYVLGVIYREAERVAEPEHFLFIAFTLVVASAVVAGEIVEEIEFHRRKPQL